MPFTNNEKFGISDLLQAEESNIPTLIQLARSVTKNVVDIETTEEALEYIFIHIPDCETLLNKRVITKEILFKYLHSKNIPVTGDFTKTLLIRKVTKYWSSLAKNDNPEELISHKESIEHHANDFEFSNSTRVHQQISTAAINSSVQPNETISNTSQTIPLVHNNQLEFPIHILAKKFSEWFFNNYNRNELKLQDFWSDARLLLRIAANDGCDDNECQDASTLLDCLYDARQRFNFIFNPNLTHAGVQGRMDVHGLVVVLACGTLHTENNCVGLFECAFGLLRDPFSENNWKIKTIQLMLRSKGAPATPSLEESDSLKEALTLPVPQGEID